MAGYVQRLRNHPQLVLSLLAVICCLLYFLRAPDALLKANFWAEDGTFFFQEAYNGVGIRSYLSPVAGYLHFIPRSTALLAVLLPVSQAAFFMNLAGSIIQLLPVFYLLSKRSDNLLQRKWAKALAALAYVCLPGSWEIHASITNSQWTTPFLISLIMLCESPRTSYGYALERVLVAFAAMSGPFAVVCLAVFGICSLIQRRVQRVDMGIILLLATAVQGYYIAHSDRLASVPWSEFQLAVAVQMTLLKSFYYLIFGTENFGVMFPVSELVTEWPMYIPAMILVAWIGFEVLRYKMMLPLALLIIGSAVLFAFVRGQRELFAAVIAPSHCGRYFYLLQLGFAVSLALLALRTEGASRWMARGLLLLSLIFAVPQDFKNPRDKPTIASWSVQVKNSFEGASPGATTDILIYPPGWKVSLVRQ